LLTDVKFVGVVRGNADRQSARVYFIENSTLYSADALNGELGDKHSYEVPEPLQMVTTEKFTLACYGDHINVYNTEKQLLKRLDGSYKSSFNYSNAVLIEHGSHQYLVRLDDMSKVSVPANTLYIENHKRHLLAIETLEDDINNNGYRVTSENFRSVWWSAPANNPILRAWIYEKSEIDMHVLVQYEDLQLAFYELKSKDKQVEARWIREEGLAYLADTLFLECQN
jgi:hypothetical protein